ncbi:hypothetical protein ACFL96_19290 [Thermoproteota archaeon]
MPKTLPNWVAEEISDSKWEVVDTFNGSGYFLDLNLKEKNADIQFYETLPGGRYIINADVPNTLKMDEYKKGDVYVFSIKIFKSVLSDKVKEFLAEQYQTNMEDINKYELISAEAISE